jgi:protocatechuate 3,4-dioxygenase beta subunit
MSHLWTPGRIDDLFEFRRFSFMSFHIFRPSRRAFLGTLASGGVLFTSSGLFADQLASTPEREEGPFYPDRLPLDTDNDLIILEDNLTPAVGEITHLTGRVLDVTGSPIKGATVEIWQCDANGVYHHSGDLSGKENQYDKNFQGYGRFTTGSNGKYYFRTIKPVPYPGRPAPHIHFKINKKDRELLTTQMNIAGHPGNEVDGIASGGLSVLERELLRVEFKPVKGSKIGELAANFDIVLGRTPDERSFKPRAHSQRLA